MTLDLSIAFGVTLALTIAPGGLSVTVAPTSAVEIPLTVIGASAGGDMRAAVYDPRAIAADVFDLAHHTGRLASSAVEIDGGVI